MKILIKKECIAREMEEQIEKFKDALGGRSGFVSLDVSAIEKIDTAGLQAIVSMIETLKKAERKYEIHGNSEALELILKCYGINL